MRTECTPLPKCLLICVQRSLLKQGSSAIVSSLTIPFLEWIVNRVPKRIHFSSLPHPRTYRLDPFLDMPFTRYFLVLLLENDENNDYEMFIFSERRISEWGNQFLLGLEPFLYMPFTRYLLVLPLENDKNNNYYFLGESDRGTRRPIPFWVRLSRY